MVSFETGPRVLHLEAGYWIGPTPPHCRRESDHQRALQRLVRLVQYVTAAECVTTV
jgi:hypothetical protein